MWQADNHWCELGFAEPAVVFKGPTQTARSVTEAWVALHGFCPNCSADRLPQLPNNSPVADFRCDACGEEYELKAKRGRLGRSIPDGAFSTMTARLAAANNPSLFAMSYDRAAASTCATKARRRAAGCSPSWARSRRSGVPSLP